MAENETKRDTVKQLNFKLYPSDIERFNEIRDSMENVNNSTQAFLALMDFWENSKTVVKDNPALVQKIADLEAEAQKRTDEMIKLRADIETLTSKNSELQQITKDNGQASSALQIRIDELEAENAALKAEKNVKENVITTEVHPVAWYFLKQMVEKETKRTGKPVEPGRILTVLFIRDLQNPRSNNLPYIVKSSEIADVQKKYEASMKKKAAAESSELDFMNEQEPQKEVSPERYARTGLRIAKAVDTGFNFIASNFIASGSDKEYKADKADLQDLGEAWGELAQEKQWDMSPVSQVLNFNSLAMTVARVNRKAFAEPHYYEIIKNE